jgi:hypothetical protein
LGLTLELLVIKAANEVRLIAINKSKFCYCSISDLEFAQ